MLGGVGRAVSNGRPYPILPLFDSSQYIGIEFGGNFGSHSKLQFIVADEFGYRVTYDTVTRVIRALVQLVFLNKME